MKTKNKEDKKKSKLSKTRLNRRIFFIGLIFLISIGYLSYQVAAIKVYDGEDYQKIVLNRMMSLEGEISPQRGAIVDRNNKTIVTSILSYHVILDPMIIAELKEEEKNKVYETLAEHIKRSKEDIQKAVERNPKSRYFILVKNLSAETSEILKSKKLKGVRFEESFIRRYPKGEFASQLIGFFSEEGRGQYGIEQQFDDLMTGKAGRIFSQLQDEQIITTEIKPAENGGRVVLTIDEVIQQYVEGTMKKYIDEWEPLNASAIIMNPNTGEIYSMFSYPTFNPNQYTNLEEQLGKNVWEAMKAEERSEALFRSWKNFNINNYEPGSTFKPLFTAAALDESIINTEGKYVCQGSKTVGDTTIRCWKREGHGEQTLEEALANSCNVAMMEIVDKVSSETLLSYMQNYGFGQATNIGLPGEGKGELHSKLGPVEKGTYSMGQGFTVTPLQLITAFSSLINGGYLMQPYVVSSVLNEKNEILFRNKPTVKRQVISHDTSKIITNYLKKVIEQGTGINAHINGYDIGGKTGTAEKLPREDKKHIYSFIGYAPINNPQVIGIILFDDIPEGTGAPTKAFKDMMTNILPYLDIELAGERQKENEETVKVPQLVGLDIYEAAERLNRIGLDYEVIGIGKEITGQHQNEGALLPKGSPVILYVKTDTPDNIVQTPKLQGLTVEEAKLLVGDYFVLDQNKDGIIETQVPKAGHKVEKNSKIIVTTLE